MWMRKHREPTPDTLQSFGYKIGWFAVPSADIDSILRAFWLRQPAPCNWAEGVTAAYQGKVFVTPPVRGWVLLPSRHWLWQLDREPGCVVGAAVRALSKQLGVVQFFASHRVPELHLWAQATTGRLLRGYGYIGEIGETVWDEGNPTAAELEVGPFDADHSPNEESVMQVAARWSVNPCELDQSGIESALGVLCSPPAAMPAEPAAPADQPRD
jgi:hypothetical protein